MPEHQPAPHVFVEREQVQVLAQPPVVPLLRLLQPVQVLDDVGARGEEPAHRALLDWLAVDFVEDGWRDWLDFSRALIPTATGMWVDELPRTCDMLEADQGRELAFTRLTATRR